jgi:hypothetical protein
MPHKKVFKISVPKPCSENWNAMEMREEGRFCENCKKLVVDFSKLTNEELYYHFSKLTTTPCGRFNSVQLDIDLIPKTKEGLWKRLYKPVAAVLAFLMLKNSEATIKNAIVTTQQPSNKKDKAFLFQDKVTISGSVKDENGQPLKDAEVVFDQKIVVKTNEEGKFQFEFEVDDPSKFYLLQISYPGLIRTARNYYPAMQSASFNVVLEKFHYSSYTSGWANITTEDFQPAYINFAKGEKQLTTDSKTELADLAYRMRNRPEVSVKIVAYATSANEIALAKKRQEAIKKHMIDQEGISLDHFKFKIEPKTVKMQNSIEISLAGQDD